MLEKENYLNEFYKSIELESYGLEREVFYSKESMFNKIVIQKIIKYFHAIKGISKFLGLDLVCQIAAETEKLLKKVYRRDMILFREKVIPVIDLKKSLGEPVQETQIAENDNKFINIVIIKENGEEYGVKVDGFIGQQEIVIKNIEGDYHRGKGVVGATILGDGRVAMVVDVKEMIEIGLK